MPDYYQGPDAPVQVLRAPINLSGTGQKTVVDAVAGKKIRVIAIHFVTKLALTIQAFSAAANALTGPMAFGVNGQFVNVGNLYGIWETNVGEALNFTLTGTTPQVSGSLVYVLI